MTLKSDAKFKWKLISGLKKWQGIWLIFTQAVESLKICFWWVPFVESLWSFRWKSTEEWSFMTLESAAKFEENCLLVSKNDMMNLVNFIASTAKSENLHFDALLLSIAYKCSAKKVQKSYLLWQWHENFDEF